MRYTVTWKPATKDQLAEIWMTAPDRAAVSAAANAVDRLLRDNAENEGIAPAADLSSATAIGPDKGKTDTPTEEGRSR